MVSVFFKCWTKAKEEYFSICENYIKFKFQCTYSSIRAPPCSLSNAVWVTAIVLRQSWEVETDCTAHRLNYLLCTLYENACQLIYANVYSLICVVFNKKTAKKFVIVLKVRIRLIQIYFLLLIKITVECVGWKKHIRDRNHF